MKKKKIFSFSHDLFTNITVCIGVNGDEVYSWIKKYSKKLFDRCIGKDLILKESIDSTNVAKKIRFESEGMLFFFIIFKTAEDAIDDSIVLHELVHVKQDEWEDRSISGEKELEAYYISSMFEKLRKEIKKQLK